MTKFQKRKQAALDNLNGMLTLFKEYGWVQENWGSPETGFCLIGANRHANSAGENDACAAINAVVDASSRRNGIKFAGPIDFNDAKSTTEKDVLRVVRRAKRLVAASTRTKQGDLVLIP